MTNNNRVLIVDDDPNLLRSLSDILGLQDFEVLTASDGKSAIRKAEADSIEAALIDLNLTDMPGLDVLSEIKRVSPDTECMLLTGYASQETAIEAVNRGAFAYFQKPYDIDALILAIHRAIEKRQSQIALAISEARHQMVAELASDYVFEMDVDEKGDLTNSWISESFARITGYTSEEVDQRGGWKTVIYPEDVSSMEKQVERLLSNQKDISEYRIVRKDGGVRWIEEITRPIMDNSSRRVIKIIGAARDITEKKEAQVEILAQAEKLEGIYKAAPIGIGINANRVIIEANERFCQITGYSKEEIIGRSTRMFYPSDEIYELVGVEREKPRNPGNLFEIETQFKRKDGNIIDVLIRSNPRDVNDDSKGYVFTVQDFTGIKLAERSLIESETRYRNIFDVAPVGIAVHQQGKIVFANPAGLRLLGAKSPEELIGKDISTIIHPDHFEVARQRVLDMVAGKKGLYPVEELFVRLDGQEIDVELMATPLTFQGKPAIQSIVIDISERKRSEKRLIDSEERYRSLFENMTAGFVLFEVVQDDNGNPKDLIILAANHGFEETTSLKSAEVIGKRLTQVLPGIENDNFDWIGSYGNVALSGIPLQLEHHSDLLDTDYSVIAYQPNTKQCAVTFTNITDRKQREKELRTVALVSETLRKASTQKEISPIIIDILINQVELNGATIELLQKNGDRLIVAAGGVWKDLIGTRIPKGEGIGAEVIVNKTPSFQLNVNKNPKVYSKEPFIGIDSAACVPLMVEDQPIGLIWAGSTAELDEMDLQLITSLANIAANAIHRAALYEQTLHRLDELNALRSIDQAINSSTDLHLTLDLIVKQLKNLSGADAVDILIYHPALMTLRYAAGEGFQTEEIRKSTLRIGEGGAGRVALEQQPLWISDMRQAEGECVRKELLMAEGFTAYHAFPLVVKGEIKGVLEVFQRAPFSANDDWKDTLETVATQTAIAIDNSEMFDGMKRLNTELILAYDETIEGWAAALELRDHDTEGHSRRVTEHTLTMARAAGMSPDELTHVRRGALLHDIGKIGVPDNILQKPGPLDDNEWIIMREHPKISYQLLSKVMYLKPALDIPYCHHEHWDGSGYPRGLKGEEIPLAARLFTVVDVYDALTSDRPYRKAWTREQALKHIKAEAGKQFDPKVVKLFLKTLDY
jgi:PAS domain S-box-containing protein